MSITTLDSLVRANDPEEHPEAYADSLETEVRLATGKQVDPVCHPPVSDIFNSS